MDNGFYNSPEWMQLRAQTFRRDGYRCVDCGSVENLQAHHLVNWNYEKPQLSQLITLCSDCHNRRHSEQEAAERAALASVGALVNEQVYRMYLCGVWTNPCIESPTGYLYRIGFSRFLNAKSESTAMAKYSSQIERVLVSLGYAVDSEALGSYTTHSDVMRMLSERVGAEFDCRVRIAQKEGRTYYNVRYNEIYPVTI